MKTLHLRWMAAALTAAVCITVFLAAQTHPAQAQSIDCADTAATGIPQAECQALVPLVNYLYGNWGGALNFCDGYSVGCTSGHVTALNMSERNMSGAVPDLSALTYLEVFNGSKNSFTGTLPSWIALAPALKILDLDGNKLAGEVPAGFADITWEELDLSYNALSATNPDIIALLNQQDPDFFTTQTIAPTGFVVTHLSQINATISWTPVTFTSVTGGYDIRMGINPNNLYSSVSTDSKQHTELTFDYLTPGTTYYVEIRSYTNWHDLNRNTVYSLYGTQFSFTTSPGPYQVDCTDTVTNRQDQADCEVIMAELAPLLPEEPIGPPCLWTRIHCEDGHVTSMYYDYYDLPLATSFPELSGLTQLEYLHFNCACPGGFPAWIAASPTLKTVDIGYSQLSGPLLDLSAMVALEELILHHNDFSGPLPDISMLPHLRRLALRGNNFSGTLHAGVTASSSLEVLDISSNALSGPLPDMSAMSSLALFDADNNQFSGPLPALPPNVALISLAVNHLTGEIPASYGDLQGGYLYLNGNMLTGEVPANLHIMNPYLSYNALTAADPEMITWLTNTNHGYPDFFTTQTIPPTGISVSNVTHNSADLSWTPILYTADAGAYEVGLSTTGGSGYVFSHTTADKLATGIALSGLTPNTTYYAVVRTVTLPHKTTEPPFEDDWSYADNPNTVTSLNSAEFSFTTGFDPDVLNCADTATTGIPQAECEILMAEIAPVVPEWERNQPPCTWTVVYCLNNHVTSISMHNDDTHPDIHTYELLAVPDLSGLTQLGYLSLQNVGLTGPIPAWIAESSTLQLVNLSSNELSGAIPDLSAMTSLWGLTFRSNNLEGALPAIPPNLEALHLSNNRLSGNIPSSYANLIGGLELTGNKLTGEVPAEFVDTIAGTAMVPNLNYNALTAATPGLVALLNQSDPQFSVTQTVPPTGIAVSNVTHDSATLSWTPIAFTDHAGAYEIGLSTTSGSGYVFNHSTVNKSAAGLTASNLTPNTTYYAVVRTVTQPHDNYDPRLANPNTVTSQNSAEFSFTTGFDPDVLNCANTAATGIPQAECEALVSEIYPLVAENEQDSLPCELSGISCENGHVTSIYTTGRAHLATSIPELSALTHLENFQFHCPCIGSFPAWIAASPSLKIVGISNQLSGTVPDLSAMVSLEVLTLSGNDFSGPLPDIAALPNLQVLSLASNNFSGMLHNGITASTSLQNLNIMSNMLSGPLPDMSGMTSLTTFYAGDNQFIGSLPQFPPTISELVLDGNQLTGEVPAGFADITWDETPELSYNALSVTAPSVIALLTTDDPDFFTTQTIPPTGITASNVTPTSADLSWTPIQYTADTGAYEIGVSTTSGGGYTFSHSTANKSSSGITLSSLTPNTTYYVVVRTVTQPHVFNPSTVTSLNSAEFTFTTGFDPNVLNCADTATTGIPQAECQALVDKLYPYLPETEQESLPCEINGIGCENGHVTVIDDHILPQTPYPIIRNTLPDLSALTHLEYLHFNCECTESFPTWIANSQTLKNVIIGGQLSGNLPDLSAMVSLEELYIPAHNFSGSLPDISMLPNLRILELSDNDFSGPLHAGITGSTSLEFLGIMSNALTGPLPNLSGMTSLKGFHGSDNQFSGSLPEFPAGISDILLSLNRFTGAIPASYSNLLELNVLGLNGNSLTGEVPANLKAQSVYFGFNALTATDPATIAWLIATADINYPDFFTTQTIAPTVIAVSNVTPVSADLSWTPILYTADSGSYEIGLSTTSGSGYVFGHSTANKSASGITLNGLTPGTTYYAVVRTVTQPHANNPNNVTSLNSAEFSFTTLIDPVSAPVLLSPAANGTVRGTNSPVLSWLPNPAGEGVTAYQLLLKNDATGAKVLKQTISAANCAAVCTVDLGGFAPQIDLALGVYNWQVTATGSLGANKSVKQRFSVVKPNAPVITASLGTVSDPQPDLMWTVNPDDLNTRYKLVLVGANSGVIFKKTVTGVCSGPACAVGLDVLAGGPYLLNNDSYTLTVTAVNEIGNRKSTGTFKVRFPAPAVSLAPSGGTVVNIQSPVLSWMPDPNASSFRVILQRIKNGAVVKTYKVNNIVNGTQGFVCSAGICTLDLAALTSPLSLPKGNYAWTVISSSPAIHPTSTSKSTKAKFKIVLP